VDLHGDKAAWKLVDANGSLVQEVRFDIHYPDDINTLADFEQLIKN
jgi:CTP:molybdopterin cytidylyltransferase MocA